ncbi:MAG: ABC-2 family transporter protein [Anaerolineae bacterium]|nr:ABC-2 family transporter protein [Anaerolineae bacterium]
MKKTFSLIWGYARHNLMSAMEYRAAFLLQAFGMALNNVIFLFFWWVLFTRLPDIRGWTMEMVATIFGQVALAFGLANAVFGNCMRIASTVVTGDLDYYLALPADPLIHLIVSRTSFSAWGDAISGVGIYLFFVPDSLIKLPLFLLYALFGALIFVGFAVIVGSLVFFVRQSEDVSGYLYNAIITFSLYPIDIFPQVVRLLLYTLIPAAMVGTFPARLLFEFRWSGLLGLVGFTALILGAGYALFNLGLRRYESGNRVMVRG